MEEKLSKFAVICMTKNGNEKEKGKYLEYIKKTMKRITKKYKKGDIYTCQANVFHILRKIWL